MTVSLVPSSGRESPSTNQMISTDPSLGGYSVRDSKRKIKSRTERNQVELLFELINKFLTLYSKIHYFLKTSEVQSGGSRRSLNWTVI